ncbi:LysR family transcriptional regulator [Solirhodobacter olei]|uniref:LysR family transcriptional regulator n=1 Tax=Solirhodobacter olei TaxID=2493082 RepID=UPI0013E3647E|nr:LysR family transcriptional regulator [Solirhodobacter olei]
MVKLDQITLRQLRALRLVEEHGTISAAAAAVGLTPPAVHSQVKTLEEIIGAPLLDRDGRQRGVLSAQGRVLVRTEAQIEALLDRALREVTALQQGRTGTVVLGAVSTAKYVAPKIVALLDTEYPGIEVVLKIANRQDTIAALGRGEYDLCIMGRPPRSPLTEATALADHPHLIIAPPGHPLTGDRRIHAAELARERFILRESGSGTRLLAERYLGQLGDVLRIERIEMDSNETIKQAVMSGLGIALISADTVANEVETGRLAVIRAEGTPIIRKWYLLTPLDLKPAPATRVIGAWIGANGGACFPGHEVLTRCAMMPE